MGKETFHEWEIRHDLLSREINGFRYWEYMRRDMLMSFGDEYAEVEPAFYQSMKIQAREGMIPKIEKAFRLFIPDRSDIKESDILFLCHSRRQEIDGKMVSIYTDYVADRFPGSVTLQRTGQGKYSKDRIYTKNLIFLDKICIKSYIYRYFVKVFRSREYFAVKHRIKDEMLEAFKDLSDNFGLHPDPEDFSERSVVLYYLYKNRRPQYEKLIKKISPKVIIEVVGGSFDAKIINEITYTSDVETIELQHGTGALTIWYPENVRSPQFPKWYFTFGDFWKDGMQPPIPRDHIISAGFPYHDMEMGEYPAEKREHDKNTIIFLSSRKYGKEFSCLAAELKRIKPELHVIFKLHPREYADYKEKYTALKDADIEVVADNCTPLYGLFARCSMQVGVESTAIYEGMGFNLTTYIWDIPKAVSMKDIVEKGYAEWVKDASDLAKKIDERKEDGTGYDLNAFWKENGMENIVNGIRKVMEGTVNP